MDFKKQYEKETNNSPYVYNEKGELTQNFSYGDGYVLWLEDKLKELVIPHVVGRSEQLVAFLEFVEGFQMLEVDLEYEEIARRFLRK